MLVVVRRQRHVAGHRDHLRGDRQVVARRGQLGARTGRHRVVAGVQRLEQRRQRAVLRDQRGRGLVADAGDAGQAVARVAPQRREVGVRAARDAVLRGHPRLVDDVGAADAAGGVEDPHRAGVVDQLEQVAVAGHDVDRTRVAHREGADHVVGLVAVDPEARDAERLEHVLDDGDLRGQRVRDLLLVAGGHPVRLVRRQRLDPERGAPVVVHRRDQPARLPVADQPGDEVEQAAHRVDRGAVRRGHRVGHPEERPEVQRRGVEQQQLAGVRGHGPEPARSAADGPARDACARRYV